MWNLNMQDNEWLTGLHYPYNEDYDQTRKEIQREIADGTFVEDADYDTEGYYTIATKVRYKQYVDNSIRGSVNAGFVNRNKSRQVEITDTSVELKENDRFKLMEQDDDEKGFKITEIDYYRNTHKTMATLILPGLYDKYNGRKILTLR